MATAASMRLRRAVVAWLGMALLAFNVLAGAALSAGTAEAAASPFSAALEGGTMVVCTAAGLKVIDLDGKSPPVSAAQHGGMCMFCLPLMHGGIAVPLAATAPLPSGPLPLAVPTPPSAERGPSPVVATMAAPRAPPRVHFDIV